MKTLKKFFPISFKFVKDGGNLAVGIIIYVLVGLAIPGILTVLSLLLNLIASILPILLIITVPLGFVVGIINTVIGLYCLAGIIIEILVFTKTIKDPDAPIEVEAVESNTDAE